MLIAIKRTVQHLLNPLHVYCRLRGVGLSGCAAVKVSALYERFYRMCGLR